MVIINSLLIVVVLESSAKNSHKGSVVDGDSKNVNNAQLSHAALPNIVTYESNSCFGYFDKLFP